MLEYTYEKLLQQNMYTVTSQPIFDLQKSVSNSCVGQKPISNSRVVVNLKSGNVAVITEVRKKAFNALRC